MYFSNDEFASKPSGGLAQRDKAVAFRLRTVLSLFALLAGLFVSERAFAQITVGSTTEATITNSTTLSFQHEPGTGGNKLLLVAIGVGSTIPTFTQGENITPPVVTGVTFNGVAMTLVAATIGTETRSVVYSLLNPPAGPSNVVITTASSQLPNGSNIRINGSATTFTNVNQVTPLGTPVTDESSTNGATLNLTIASTAATDIVYSAVTVDGGNNTQTISANVGQTELSNQSGTATYLATNSATSYESGTGSSVTSTYTFSDPQDHSGIAVLVKGLACPSPNCGTVTLTKLP